MTPFAALLTASGLSQREAAQLFARRAKSTIAEMCQQNARYKPSDDELKILAQIVDNNQEKADNLAAAIFDKVEVFENGKIEIAISNDDFEAQQNGFPFKSAELASIGLALAQLDNEILSKVKLLPRGSTVALAKAEDVMRKNIK